MSIKKIASLPPIASMSFVYPKKETWDYVSQNALLTVVLGFYMTMTRVHTAFIVWGVLS